MKHVVYLDFHEHKEYKTFFAGALDVNTLTLNISLGIRDAKFVPGKTCLVFDEIQDCPNARSSLKFFKLDGRYDVICTGSLLGVNGYKTKEEEQEEKNASIPVGFEQIVSMYPMDFEDKASGALSCLSCHQSGQLQHWPQRSALNPALLHDVPPD